MNRPSNVDSQEIGKFDRVAQLWWDPTGKMGMLHLINPLRSQFTFEHADVQGKRVVDVGCGGGILTETLARAGAQVVGIDQSELTLQAARKHAEQEGLAIDYRIQTVEALALQESGSFDVVTCLEMLEHVPNPAAVIDACARLLKPGGTRSFPRSTATRRPGSSPSLAANTFCASCRAAPTSTKSSSAPTSCAPGRATAA